MGFLMTCPTWNSTNGLTFDSFSKSV